MNLYKILIVDDEFHIVDWLVDLFCENENLEIYKAYTVTTAKEILEKNKIDIVLSDIKMPGMSGFDLADTIVSKWKHCKIIFLTAHGNFNYIYKANKYADSRYLLKTEDDDVIISSIEEVIKEIESEKKNLSLIDDSDQAERTLNYFLKREELINIIEAESLNIIPESSSKILFSKPIYILCVNLSENPVSKIELNKLAIKIKTILTNYLDDHIIVEVIDYEGSFLCLLQSNLSYYSNDEMNAFINEINEDIIVSFSQNLENNCFVLFYNEQAYALEVKTIFSYLKQIAEKNCRENKNISNFRNISKNNLDVLSKENKIVFNDFEMKQNIFILETCFLNNEKDNFNNIMDKITKKVKSIKSVHYPPAISLYMTISNILLQRIIHDDLTEKVSFQIGLNKLYSINSFKTIGEAFVYLKELSGILFDICNKETNENDKEFIYQIQEFISKNVGNELTLSSISRHLNYNPSYISRIFKQMTNTNLFDYINNEKIIIAKKKLASTQSNVQIIAKETGFTTSQYFSTVFKKHTGMTPQEYRNSLT